MSKEATLKKQLVKLGAIVIVANALLGAAFFAALEFYSQGRTEVETIEREIRDKKQRLSQLEEKFNIYEGSYYAYTNLYNRLSRGQFALDIHRARAALDALRKRHRISDMSVNISSQEIFGQEATASSTPAAGTTTEYVGFQPIIREVVLKFGAPSDVHVYALVDSIVNVFPGFIRIQAVSIRQLKPFDAEVIRSVREGNIIEMVDSEIKFQWIGIEELQDAKPE